MWQGIARSKSQHLLKNSKFQTSLPIQSHSKILITDKSGNKQAVFAEQDKIYLNYLTASKKLLTFNQRNQYAGLLASNHFALTEQSNNKKNTHSTLRKNAWASSKQLVRHSSSKSKSLFNKARSVSKQQTFLKKKQPQKTRRINLAVQNHTKQDKIQNFNVNDLFKRKLIINQSSISKQKPVILGSLVNQSAYGQPHLSEDNLSRIIQSSIRNQMQKFSQINQVQLQLRQKEKQELKEIIDQQLESNQKALLSAVRNQINQKIQGLALQLNNSSNFCEPLRQPQLPSKNYVVNQTKKYQNVVKEKDVKNQQMQFKRPIANTNKNEQKHQVSSIPKQIQKQNKPKISRGSRQQIDDLDGLQEINLVDRKSNHDKKTTNNANKRQQNKLSPPNQQSIYRDVDNSMIVEDQLKPSPAKTTSKINQSFYAGDRLNQSFQSTTKTEAPYRSKPPKTAEDLQREKLRAEIIAINKKDAYITSLGEVGGYCYNFIKKSQLPWQLPSLLLFRYCYLTYRSYDKLYQRSTQLKILKPEDTQRFREQNKIIQQNLQKLKKAALKKTQFNQKQLSLIQGQNISLQILAKQSQKQVKNFVKSLKQSKQMQNIDCVKCGLRMINAIFIVRSFSSQNIKALTTKLQDDKDKEYYTNLFNEWSIKLDRLAQK